jgi:N-acetylneuraminic acid mutarotase
MHRSFFLALALLIATAGVLAEDLAPLPSPLSNNAVTAVKVKGTTLVYSFMGLGPERTSGSVSNVGYALNLKYNKWTTIRSAPGSGRLGTVAESAREQVFLIGGFVPDRSGMQAIVADLSIYDPVGLRWYRGPDLPTPVRDAVVGSSHDRYIYVIGGLAKGGPTNAVQVYDVEDQHCLDTPEPL